MTVPVSPSKIVLLLAVKSVEVVLAQIMNGASTGVGLVSTVTTLVIVQVPSAEASDTQTVPAVVPVTTPSPSTVAAPVRGATE